MGEQGGGEQDRGLTLSLEKRRSAMVSSWCASTIVDQTA